ncbi:dynein axonemal light chain 4 isoform X2 [Bos mutus]|uniref:Dynein light chain n=2 Tax=Bos TaxID=9903 RepID=A0AAA9TTP3_BOVIN|nr:dynein axonemal light chain 4 isoform X2 [Bos taurus]XP_061274544.1 dynein axonemal light chain 4 isoform X2 [Bos javanicus]
MGETEGKKDEADYKRLQTFPLVRHSDMPEEMRVETMELCVTACEKFSNNNESAAKMIKETMDKKFGSSWHVVIGEGFGFEITHERCFFKHSPHEWGHRDGEATDPALSEFAVYGGGAQEPSCSNWT